MTTFDTSGRPKKTEPAVSIWATSTDMAGSEFQRKTYFMTLKDGDKETKFSLQIHANGTIVAVPYVDADYDYTEYDDGLYPGDDEYVAEEDWEDDEEVFYYD
jgi:hypothetical protein